jgi:hypothetical protein
MKNDLIITRFKTENIIGTKSSYEPKTFFGSKMVSIENKIIIDNSNIQYSELYYNDIMDSGSTISGSTVNNGYQYYIDYDMLERNYLINLSDLKGNNHTINLLSQSIIDKTYNTNWNILINWKDILSKYLFYRLKEARTFKAIKYTDVINENINNFINDYISENLLNRYQFESINLYIEYISLNENDINKNPDLMFNPKFNYNIKNNNNLINNVNASVFDTIISLNYKQTDISSNSTFNYYFDLILNKI